MNGDVFLGLLILVAGFAALGAQSRLDIAGPLRNWFNARDAGRVAAQRPLPPTVARVYWTMWEYRKDAARYSRLGYHTETENLSEPYVVNPIIAQIYSEPRMMLGRTRMQPPRRRVPVAYVTYSRLENRRTSSEPLGHLG